MITKVEAIKKVLEEFGGVATWEQIYNTIEKFHPAAKSSKEWKAGIRGVLYREIKNNRNFKKVGLGIYALKEYQEEPVPTVQETQRNHSYMEGICLEIGKFKGYHVYTPDKSALFKDNIYLKDIATLENLPPFTYPEIVNVVKRIDVLWFNDAPFPFPQMAFEVVDTVSTLSDALNRCFQLIHFNTRFLIIGPSDYRNKFIEKMKMEPYSSFKKRFGYKDYELTHQLYANSVKQNKIEEEFFKA